MIVFIVNIIVNLAIHAIDVDLTLELHIILKMLIPCIIGKMPAR